MSLENDEDLVIDEDVNDTEVEAIENSEVSEEENPENVQDEDDEEDRIVTIGDSEPENSEGEEESEEPEETPDWVKKVRKVNRKQASEIKKLKKQLEAKQKAAEINKPVELGEKPTLKSCKYDDAKYELELMSYYERKRKVDEQEAKRKKTIDDQNEAYESKKRTYVDKKKEYGFKDFSEAEDLVVNTFSEIQQGIMVDGVKDAVLMTYALGKNPKKLDQLAKLTNNIEFAVELGRLEGQLKMGSRKAPNPERKMNKGSSGGGSDNTLEKLETEALKTGDRTKIVAYKRKLRNKGK